MGSIVKCPHCNGVLIVDASIKTEVSISKIPDLDGKQPSVQEEKPDIPEQ
jgi:hypothetical protein